MKKNAAVIILAIVLAGGFGIYLVYGRNQDNMDSFFAASLTPETPEVSENNLSDVEEIPDVDIDFKEPESQQDLLDDIQEKLDVISQQIQELQKQNIGETTGEIEVVIVEEQDEEKEVKEEKKEEIVLEEPEEAQIPVYQPVTSGGPKVYPKLLISEIQTAGDEETDEFVELFNPNDTDVDLTDWYLQKKTKTGQDYSSYASSNLLAGKRILAKSYFLICRQEYNPQGLCNVGTEYSLSEDNSLILKNPNREISDKVGWGEAQDFEAAAFQNPLTGQSIGRKLDEQDTDNNFLDFELNSPTPKAENIAYVPPPPPLPKDETPPEVVFSLAEIQNSLNFLVNFEITDPIGTVTPSGLASYIFRFKEDGRDWQQDLEQEILDGPTFHRVQRDFTANPPAGGSQTYYFQANAKDLAGNESGWLPEIGAITTVLSEVSPSDARAIVINEIQTEGQTVKDEFIELYNPNEQEVNLEGYSLKKKTSGGTESNLVSSASFTGVIPALGYFLIVPQINEDGTPNYTGPATPDLFYSGRSYSIASNNTVLLYNSSEVLLDKVGWGEAQDFETAPAPNPEATQSIKRTSSGADTGDNSVDFVILNTPTPKAD